MKKQFDLLSDIHLDFWVKLDHNPEKMNEKINDFIDSILPDEISDVLVIPGDLGHYNSQNVIFLNLLKAHYKNILVVFGNHDYYLLSNNIEKKYHYNSFDRSIEMKELAQNIEGIHYLEGDKITIDGITYGGTGMWYDFSFGVKTMGLDEEYLEEVWNNNMNDSRTILGFPLRVLEMFKKEKAQLDSVFEDCDVIITHVGPDWSKIPMKYQADACTSFYYFDGTDYFDKIKDKIWVFGHTHTHYDYTKNGCWFVNNSKGYPGEIEKTVKIVNIPL